MLAPACRRPTTARTWCPELSSSERRLSPLKPCGQCPSKTLSAQAQESLSGCRTVLSRVCPANKGEFRRKTANYHRRSTCRKLLLSGKTWSPDRESNSGPTHYECVALPTELSGQQFAPLPERTRRIYRRRWPVASIGSVGERVPAVPGPRRAVWLEARE